MYADSPFAKPVGSFRTPVPVPVVDPDSSPTLSVSINCSWLPYIRGALQQLALQSTWATSDPATLLLAQQRALTLIAMFTECSGALLPFDCDTNFVLGPNPFATWALGDCGEWVPVDQYRQTVCGPFSGVTYGGLNLQVTLDNPVTITHIGFTYDLVQGNFNDAFPGDIEIDITDGTHGTILASITLSHLVDGTDQVITWDGMIAGVQTISFNGTCDKFTSGGASGQFRIHEIHIAGLGNPGC